MAREQNTKNNPENNCNGFYDDEIDLFELFQKIWKWKWLTIVLMFIFCTTTFFYIKTMPVTYTINSSIRIGKIANTVIEQNPEIQVYLQSEVSQQNKACSKLLAVSGSGIINISCKSDSPDLCYSCLEKSINNLLNRHNIIYNKALKKFNENITSIKTKIIIDPVYFLDTYTFPSSLVLKPEKAASPDNNKLSLKIAVAFFSSLFLGIFLSFFIEYIINHKRKTD